MAFIPRTARFAEARITWGDPGEEVLEELVRGGMNREQAADLVRRTILERREAITTAGIHDLVVGAAKAISGPLVILLAVVVIFQIDLGFAFTRLLGLVLLAFGWMSIRGIVQFGRGLERTIDREHSREPTPEKPWSVELIALFQPPKQETQTIVFPVKRVSHNRAA